MFLHTHSPVSCWWLADPRIRTMTHHDRLPSPYFYVACRVAREVTAPVEIHQSGCRVFLTNLESVTAPTKRTPQRDVDVKNPSRNHHLS